MSILYIAGAVLALSFLVFIHELGHYWMARRTGMRVETFSIGFGAPLISWMAQGVKWQIGWLPFGGYVKIAGMEGEAEKDPYTVKDGFFGKSPWARIQVALAGPLVNILFALLAFSLLWAVGGRLKPFSDFTAKIGWVDPSSELYQKGIRPGDEIYSYNGTPYKGFNDLIYLSIAGSGPVDLKGAKVDQATGKRDPYALELQPYSNPLRPDKSLKTIGVLQPASFLIYDRNASGAENPLPESSPMLGSGLKYGDRLVWVDGHLIYSPLQLSELLNDGRALLTIERQNETFLARVPRVEIQDLKFDAAFKEELSDWQHEAGLDKVRFANLLTLPYNLTNEGVVENEVHFIDREHEERAFPETPYSPLEAPLKPGDRIVAVDGVPVVHSAEILKAIQARKVHVIVDRPKEKVALVKSRDADALFDRRMDARDAEIIAATIGSKNVKRVRGELVLLEPVAPKTYQDIFRSATTPSLFTEELAKQRRTIEAIEDPEQRAELLKALDRKEQQFVLGIPQLRDLKVQYNPVPTDQFMNVFNDITRTMGALFSGNLSPKWLSGPVGIVYMFQEQSKTGIAEALYWLGMISLNLGVLNLLPIPVLDGGTVVLSLFEGITGKRISPKVLEKLILPFAVLLILFFLYWTYNDVARIFSGFFK